MTHSLASHAVFYTCIQLLPIKNKQDICWLRASSTPSAYLQCSDVMWSNFCYFFSSCAWRTMLAEICQRNGSINRSLLTGRDAKWSCSVSKKTLGLLKSKMKNDKWTYFIGKTKGIDKTIDIWCREHLQEHVLGLAWANSKPLESSSPWISQILYEHFINLFCVHLRHSRFYHFAMWFCRYTARW